MQDALDLKSDMTIDMTGQVTTLVSCRSQGTGRMMNPQVMGATNTQTPVTGTNTTNPIASTPYHCLGEPSGRVNPGRWVWMQLENHQLNPLPAYQRELNIVVVFLVLWDMLSFTCIRSICGRS